MNEAIVSLWKIGAWAVLLCGVAFCVISAIWLWLAVVDKLVQLFRVHREIVRFIWYRKRFLAWLERKEVEALRQKERSWTDPEEWEQIMGPRVRCDRAPKGWTCTRDAGHEGPCVAVPDGMPCNHPGCLNHKTHPCEVCGRISGYATSR